MEHKIKYFFNGQKESEKFLDDSGRLNNEFGPAYIEYYESGNKRYESYFLHDKRHNMKGPAKIYYSENGSVIFDEYWIYNNLLSINSCEELKKYINKLIIS